MNENYKSVKPGDFGDEQEIPTYVAKDESFKTSNKVIDDINFITKDEDVMAVADISSRADNAISTFEPDYDPVRNKEVMREEIHSNSNSYLSNKEALSDESTKKLVSDLVDNMRVIEQEQEFMKLKRIQVQAQIEALKSEDAQIDRSINDKRLILTAIDKCISDMKLGG